MKRTLLKSCFVAVCLLVTASDAQTTFTWSGLGGDELFNNPSNWQGNTVPTGSSTDILVFPGLPVSQLQEQLGFIAQITTPVNVGSLSFTGDTYFFYLTGVSPITLNGDVSVTGIVGQINNPMTLAAGNHIYSGPGYLFQNGVVSGSGSITKNDPGYLGLFNSTNTYTGGTTLNAGTIGITGSGSLGTGLVTFNGGTLVDSGGTLTNNFVLGANVAFRIGNGAFVLGNGSSTLTAATGVSTVNITRQTNATGSFTIAGAIGDGSGPTTYTFTSDSSSPGFVLSGTNSYTGGTVVKNGGTVVFSTAASIPATGLISAEADGYAGIATPSDQTAFLSHLNGATFAGTVGFDGNQTYTGNIDLTNYVESESVTIGTRSEATLTGLITPASGTGGGYNFRNSGQLTLSGSNALTGAYGLTSRSFGSDKSGLVMLSQSATNSYSGVTIANGAGIIFDTAGSLSAATTLQLQNGGYISSTASSGITLATLVSKVSSQLGTPSVLGVDSSTFNYLTYASPVDFSSLATPVYLGTASYIATVSGTITTTNGGADDYYLTGYNGGHLKVTSPLTGSRALHVGLPGGADATVQLTNTSNTYTGGTELNSGYFIVAGPGSLGTGAITVNASESPEPVTLEGSSGSTLPNNIILNESTLSLYWSASTFSGTISGDGGLRILSDLTVTGANSYSGGTAVEYVQLTAATNTALGTGGLSLTQGASAFFTTTAPQLGGLLYGDTFDDGDGIIRTSSVVLTNAGASTLTINQTEDGTFDGIIAQTAGVAALVKNGTGTLAISGTVEEDNNYRTPYSGGTTINAGKLIADGPNAFGPGTITLNGGALGTAPGVTLTNMIVFGTNGGTLSGNGTFTTPITAGSNVVLSPGSSPGTMTFASGLTLASGGSLNFEVQAATGIAGTGYDLVNISIGLLDVTATAGTPFTINVVSLDAGGSPGNVADFSSSTGYSWMLYQGNLASGITGFDPTKFSLDASGFTNNLNGGVFSLSQGVNGGNPALFLNFSPVPEPSTYALMLTGLAVVALRFRRRR